MDTQTPSETNALTDPDAAIKRYQRWLYKTAIQIVGPSNANLDDLVQEASITMWQLIEKNPGQAASYYLISAKKRMLSILAGKPYTGQPSRRAGRMATVEQPCMDSLDEEVAEDLLRSDVVPDDNSRPVDHYDMAYHHREIFEAIRRLPPAQRQYVFDRFWLDRDWRELNRGLWSRRYSDGATGAKYRLAEELAHLREVTLYA